uniref:Ovule protein n=1 Tax=Parascaris univalens TaxID=6257 RepID=A0A915CEY0_PARUN
MFNYHPITQSGSSTHGLVSVQHPYPIVLGTTRGNSISGLENKRIWSSPYSNVQEIFVFVTLTNNDMLLSMSHF